MNDMPKQRRQRLASNKEFLKNLVSVLRKECLTKDQLAEKLEISDAKKLTDSVFLAAVKLEGNSIFLDNLVEKTVGRVKKGPQYSAKRGLTVPSWMFEGKNVADGQKYTLKYGIRTGVVTLTPTTTEDIDVGDDE
ncbi:MAG: hypothetical protein ACWGKN_07545 [Desulfoprunum sp.]